MKMRIVGLLLITLILFCAGCAPAPAAPSAPPAAPAGQQPAATEAAPSTTEAAAPAAPAAPEAGDKQLVVAVNPDYESFDPALAYEVYANMVLHAAYDNLTVYASDGNVQLGAAEKYELSDDQLTYTFTLKDGLKYASGKPVTASDWVWSIERAMAKEGNGAFLAEGIAKIEAPDEKTIVFTLSAPDPSFATKLTYSFFAVVEKEQVVAHGGTNDASDAATEWLNTMSAGSGPYILTSYTPKVDLVLERNTNYWGTPPYYDKITVKHVSESASQVMMVQTNDVNIALNVDAEQAKSLENVEGVKVNYCNTLTMSFLIMNRDPSYGPISNPDVQKAIRLAVDYKGIQTLGGVGSTTPIAPFPTGLFASAEPLDVDKAQNIEEAKKLMAAAGVPDGFEVDFYVPTSNVEGVDLLLMAQKVQQDLKAIGITTKIIAEDVMISLDTYRKGQQPLGLWYWSPDYPDNTSNLAFLPGNTVGLRANWKAEMNPALAELGVKAASESKDEERLKLYDEIQKMMHDDSPFVMLLQFKSQYATRDFLKGIEYNDRYKIDLSQVSR